MSQERLTVRKIKEILRLKYEAGLSNRAIGRACRVSCSTVSEYTQRARHAGLSWPLPESLSEEELYSKLFPEAKRVNTAERPMPDWETVQKELRKKGVTLRLLWQEFSEQHPDGYRYTQYCVHYRQWSRTHNPSMHREHKGGEEMEVDYAGVTLPITNPETGEISQAAVFVATLPASSRLYTEVQLNQGLSSWINGHVRAFEFFGGVPCIVRPDNLKSGVKSPAYYEPDLNPTYQELAEYYRIAVIPARVRRPKDKASVENGVQNVERWVLAPLRKSTFFSIAEANRAVRKLLEALNQREMKMVGKSRDQLFEELDKPALRPLPERPYEFAIWKKARVNIDYHVAFEKHYFSVPHPLIHEEVDLRVTERMVEIFHKGERVAVHPRKTQAGQYSTRSEHMPSHHRFVAEVNTERLLEWAAKVGPRTEQWVSVLLRSRFYPEQAYRTCLGVLNLARKYGGEQIERACQVALEARLLSYRDVKAELDHQSRLLSVPASQPAALPVHENIRGDTYYD